MQLIGADKRFLRCKLELGSSASPRSTPVIRVSDFFGVSNRHKGDKQITEPKSASALVAYDKTQRIRARKATNYIKRGLVYCLAFDFVAAAKMATAAEFECPSFDLSIGARANADLLWAIVHVANGDGGQALAHATSAASQADDEMTNYVIVVLCRYAYWQSGNFHEFDELGRGAVPDQGRRARFLTLLDRSVQAMVEWQQLRLPIASRLCRNVIDACTGSKRLASAALLPTVLTAQFAYEQGEFSEADSAIRAILPRVRAFGTIDIAVRAYITIARSAIRGGRSEFASLILREGETLALERGWPRLLVACLEERIDLLMDLGRIEEATLTLRRMHKLSQEFTRRSARSDIISFRAELARIRVAGKQTSCHAEANILRRLLAHALAHNDMPLAVRFGVRFATKLIEQDNTADACDVMARLVAVACDGGLFQTILDGGAETDRLLKLVQPSLRLSHHVAYVDSLLERWNDTPPPENNKSEKRPDRSLTARERTVLELIGLGHSNKKIAQQLGITPETVKSHAKNIFARLGSATRAEAVSRATSLGLI
jgi:LuxR family maltose regulon positive regulatory protein